MYKMLVLLLVTSIKLNAQVGKMLVYGDSTWKKNPINIYNSVNGELCLFYTQSDLVSTQPIVVNTYPRLLKIDSNLTIKIDTPLVGQNDTLAFDSKCGLIRKGKFILAGSFTDFSTPNFDTRLTVSEFDSSYNLVWRRYVHSPDFDYVGDAVLVDSSYLYVAGRGDSTWNPLFVKLDSTGTTVTFSSINAPAIYGKITKGMIQLTDSIFLIAGDGDLTVSAKDKWVIAINSNGDTLYTRVLTKYGAGWVTGVVKGYDSSYYLLGNSINRYTFWGDSISERYYSEVGTAMSMIKTNDFNYVVGGFKFVNQMVTSDFTFTKLDSNGNVIWSHHYDNAYNQDYLKSVIQTNDNGYLLYGETSYNGKIQLLIIKVDSLGELHFATTINPMELAVSDISIYPNPTKGNLFVRSKDEVRKIVIYDLSGRIIRSSISGIKKMDISELPSSAYIIEVQMKDRIYKQRIIKN